MRLQPVAGDVLGEVQVVAGEGIHGIGGGDTGLAVVAMLKSAHAVGIVHEHRVGPVLAERVDDVAEELPRVLQLAVGIAEHHHVLDAHGIGGRALLVGPLAARAPPGSGTGRRSRNPRWCTARR